MNKLKIKTLSLLLIFTMIIGMLLPVHKAEAAGISSKSFTVTVDKKNKWRTFQTELSKNGYIIADLKILKITGKAKAGNNGTIELGSYSDLDSKNEYSLFDNIKPKDLKKGAIFNSNHSMHKEGFVDLELPDGVKKMKVKITFKTKDNSKTMTTCKERIYQ